MLVIGDNIVNGTLVQVSVADDGSTVVVFPSFRDETNVPLSVAFAPNVPLAIVSGLVSTIVAAGNPF